MDDFRGIKVAVSSKKTITKAVKTTADKVVKEKKMKVAVKEKKLTEKSKKIKSEEPKKPTKKSIKKTSEKTATKILKTNDDVSKVKATKVPATKKTTKRTIVSKKELLKGIKKVNGTGSVVDINREDLAQEHDELKLTRFETGGHSKHTGYSFDKIRSEEIPFSYGYNRAVLLPVDPVLAYTFWELREDTLIDYLNKFGYDNRLVLRIYDVTNVIFDGTNSNEYWDIEVFERIGSWYIRHGKADRNLLIDIGIKAPDGTFHIICRSKTIYFPRNFIVNSSKIRWMLVDEFGNSIVSEVEDYTDDDLKLLEQILGKDRLKRLMKGELSFFGGGSNWGRIPELSNVIDLSTISSSRFLSF